MGHWEVLGKSTHTHIYIYFREHEVQIGIAAGIEIPCGQTDGPYGIMSNLIKGYQLCVLNRTNLAMWTVREDVKS
jgi:hypothetical protein